MADDERDRSTKPEAAPHAGVAPVSRWTVFCRAAVAAAGVATVVLAGAAVYALRSILVEAFIAVFLALGLDPPVRWIMRLGIRRSHAVAVIFLATLLLAAVFLWVFLPPLLREATTFFSDFPGYLGHLRRRSPTLASLENRYHLQQHLDQWIASLPEGAGGKALAVGHQFLGAVASLLLVGVLTVYFMLDLPRLREGLVTLFPRHRRERVAHALSVVSDKVGAYMIGNVAISVIAGTAALITLVILGIPFALPLAVFVALTDLLPMIGATLGAAACIIVGLSTASPLRNTIVLVLFFVAYQQLENYVIAPRVYRNSVQMPALHVLLATLIGASLLGLLGALMAIPIAAAIRALTAPALHARRDGEAT